MDFARIIRLAEMYPEKVRVYPLGLDNNCQGMARKNDKRDAYVKLSVEDEWIKGLQGTEDQRPLVFTICIPRELLDRSESPILVPGIDVPRSATAGLLMGAR